MADGRYKYCTAAAELVTAIIHGSVDKRRRKQSESSPYRQLTTQMYYVHFDETGLWYRVIARAFSHLSTKCENRNEEKSLYWSSSSDLSGCANMHYVHSTKVLSPAVDLISRSALLFYDM